MTQLVPDRITISVVISYEESLLQHPVWSLWSVARCVLQDGMTAIHLAARFGHIQVVHALQGKVSYNVTSSKVRRGLRLTRHRKMNLPRD